MSRGGWAVRLDRADARSAAALRLRQGIQVHEDEQGVWLRGEDLDDSLALALRKLPGAIRYTLGDDDRLRPVGRRVPVGVLPRGGWVPLGSWIAPEPQTAALPGTLGERLVLRLVRSVEEREPAVLVTSLRAWSDWAVAAPSVRLKQLRFAVSAEEAALIHGRPLPPLSGRRFAESAGVAVAGGFAWSPAIDAEVLRALLALEEGDLALFDEDGTYEHIQCSDFVAASRSAVRLTGERLAHG